MSDNTYNLNMATRQMHMNDYAYQNKMDTLFFFQILLFSILILCIFAYGARVGFFSNALLIYVGVILVVLNTVIFLSRYAYTVNLRDPNVWSRRRFTYQEANPQAPDVPADVSGNTPFGFAKYGLADISGVDLPGLCKAAGY
jgi:hypothetical protein